MDLPQGGLFNPKYHRWTAEQVYRELDTNDDALQQAIDECNSKNGNSDDSDSNSQSSSGDKYSNIPKLVGEVWDAVNEEGKPLNESEKEEMSNAIRSQVFFADKIASLSGTSSMTGRVDAVKGGTLNWKDLLSDLLTSMTLKDQSWSRLNKRHSWRGINLPSKIRSNEGGEIAVAIDTSGSVSQFELNIFSEELQAICESCNIDKVRVCYCDTTVRKNSEGEWWDIFDLSMGEDIELEVRGGGGTDFDPPFNLFNDYSDDVDNVCAFIYFTDAYGEVDAKVEPSVPVIWAITHNGYEFDPQFPFGENVYVNVSEFH
jgi:predicted metal-dependent peptidase